MRDQDSESLERLIDRELKRLPDLVAPETLVHRVMLSVYARERRPWWKRAWTEWPRGLQIGSLVVLAVVSLGTVTWATGLLTSADISVLMGRLASWTEGWGVVRGSLEALLNAGALVLKSAGRWVLAAGAFMVVSAYLISVGLFTAGYRLAMQRVG